MKKNNKIVYFLYLLGIATQVVATYPALADAEIEFSRSSLRIETADAVHIFDVEVATNDEQRSRGLMFRNELAPSAGMIFLYKRDRLLTMWMANTYLPLDMLFIGGDGNIVHIVENAIPLSRAMISSRRRARAVLEVNAGTVSRLEIKVGDRVFHDGLTAPYP